MGKWKAIIPITLSLVIALSGSIFLYKWLKSQTAPKQVVKVQSQAVPVAVAAVNLRWGTKLKKQMIKTAHFLEGSLPSGYLSDPSDLEGRVIIAPLRQNEPITEWRLAPETVALGGVSAVITPGKRAIAIKGDKVIGLSGFILPGNRVDVLVTMRNPSTKRDVTKTVLENILVLATGTEIEENDKGEQAPVDVYTLEVTPVEGEKLALGAAEGKIQLALRNATDGKTVYTPGATVSRMLTSFRGATKPSKKKGKVRSAVFVMEIIKGGKVITKKFRL
ncbi:MAG: Flp pilus assembly protein CpaB [Desulfatiglandales bacterium]